MNNLYSSFDCDQFKSLLCLEMSNCMERHILAVRQAMQFWGQSAGQQTHQENIDKK